MDEIELKLRGRKRRELVRILVPRELPAVNGRSHKRELGWWSDD
jgi:hypothetical protein